MTSYNFHAKAAHIHAFLSASSSYMICHIIVKKYY